MTWPCFLFPIDKEPIQRTPPFLKRTQTLVPENLHITFAFVTFIEGIPLFKGNGHLGSSIQGTVPKYSKVTMTTALTTWTISLTFRKWMYVLHLWEFYTQYFYYLAAWNNDCSRFSGRIIIIIKKNRIIIRTPPPNLHYWRNSACYLRTLASVPNVSPE